MENVFYAFGLVTVWFCNEAVWVCAPIGAELEDRFRARKFYQDYTLGSDPEFVDYRHDPHSGDPDAEHRMYFNAFRLVDFVTTTQDH